MGSTAAIAEAIRTARDDLDALRDRISDLSAERDAVATAPVDRATAEQRVRSLVDQAQARGRDLFHRPEIFTAEPQPLGAYFQRNLQAEPLAALAALCPDALVDAMLAGHEGGGMSVDGRLAKLAELDAALFAAECAEECCCRELEEAVGAPIPRRLDAPADVLLAPDGELEGGDFDPDPEPETEPSDDAGRTRRNT